MGTFNDELLQREVLDELKCDSRLSPTQIGVSVTDGVVTLSGDVESWARKVAAEEAAHRVAGVHDVANDLQVRLEDAEQPSDTAIAGAVRQALLWDVFVPETNVTSTVDKGIVTLSGSVETNPERDDAGRAVRNLKGVRSVMNNVTVDADLSRPAVHDAIKQALERRANRDADRIDIAVERGCVTVTGEVQSWGERQAVMGAARGTRGVKWVVDHLRVVK